MPSLGVLVLISTRGGIPVPKLIRLYIDSVLVGVAAAIVFLVLLVVFDVGSLRRLVLGSPDGLTGGSGALCDSSCNGNTSRGRVWCPGRSFGRVLGGVSNRDFRQVLAPLRGVIGGDDVPVAPGASEGDDGAEEWRNTAQWE